ncbi:SPOR domain-containing protein [Diaphorobacter ruginosibacter]|uniref:SPOR domain-containing protein n=1 Tax=Diaphorobacter ruginosibacter TaxID=1715720 RepID=UPI00333E7482
MNLHKQRGGLILGLILGVLVGLAAALAVAVYVTKVPVPFLNKNATRGADQDEAEAQRNKNWDPNSSLSGRNPAKPGSSAPRDATTAPPAVTGTVTPAPAPEQTASAARAGASAATAAVQQKPVSSDPLGDLARARAAAAPAPAPAPTTNDPFDYFVQAGAFRSQADADAQRAKLAMLGWEARVSEREQNGRTVFRVRIGPFGKRDDADSLKGKLEGAGIETALVRVQR